MFEDFNKYRVLRRFFLKPGKKYQLRELSRETGISFPSVKNYVTELEEEGFLETVEEGTYPGYRADTNEKFRLYKRNDTVRRLHESGLVDELEKEFRPNALVLFGSAARGEDTEESDIDILVVAGEKTFDVEGYESEFQREINLQFMNEDEILENKEFANSLANGVVLKGFLRVK